MDSCVLMVTTYTKKLGLHFGKELCLLKKIDNFVDCYAVALYNDSDDNVPSEFKSSFGSDPAHFIKKYSSINITRRTSQELKISQSHEIKKQQILMLRILWDVRIKFSHKKTHYTVVIITITFASSALEGIHRRQSLYEVLTHSQGNLESKGERRTTNIEQIMYIKIPTPRLDRNHRLSRDWPGTTLGGQAWRGHLSDRL